MYTYVKTYIHTYIHDTYIHTQTGFTALHLAIVKSRNDAAKLLINELGAKGVAAANESGITAAHVAASSGMSNFNNYYAYATHC